MTLLSLSNSNINSSFLTLKYQNDQLSTIDYDDMKYYLHYLISNAFYNTYIDPNTLSFYSDIKDSYLDQDSYTSYTDNDYSTDDSSDQIYKRLIKFSNIDLSTPFSNFPIKKLFEFKYAFQNKDKFLFSNYLFSPKLTHLTIINISGYNHDDRSHRGDHSLKENKLDIKNLQTIATYNISDLYNFVNEEHNYSDADSDSESNPDSNQEGFCSTDFDELSNMEQYNYIDSYFWNKYLGEYSIINHDGITYKDLILAIMISKGSKFDTWYELFTEINNIDLVKNGNKYNLTLYLDFDHGS